MDNLLNNKLPVKIGSEEGILNYATLLTKGEAQLLITREGNMYISDGIGGVKILNQKLDLSEIDKLIESNEVLDLKFNDLDTSINDVNLRTDELIIEVGRVDKKIDNFQSTKQISKLGITGTTQNPAIIDIPINTLDFKVPRVNILKYQPGEQDVLITKSEFVNNEVSDFETDQNIIFDNVARLKTKYVNDMIYEGALDTGSLFSVAIDKTSIRDIIDVSIQEDGLIQQIVFDAIPVDRLLIPKYDIDLSNIHSIDFFKLTGTGFNVKVVCSVDEGVTWKTFNIDNWVDINLTPGDVKSKGIDITTFNNINSSYWNDLTKSSKIRFAYLLSLNSITDIEQIDRLQLQYDSKGTWVQALESEYDVVYASNTLLQIHVKFSGNIKINY